MDVQDVGKHGLDILKEQEHLEDCQYDLGVIVETKNNMIISYRTYLKRRFHSQWHPQSLYV